jgi:acetate kinase
VGENAAAVRSASCAGLERLGIVMDEEKNSASGRGPAAIHAAGSEVKVLVIPTNEELEIAEQTLALIREKETE